MSNKLIAKVRAVNAANAYANELYEKLKDVFVNFIGDRIEKANGELFEKVKKCLPKFINTHNLSVYRHMGNYALVYVVKSCEMIPSEESCIYHETSLYVGEMRDGVLVKLCSSPNNRIDYTVNNVREKRLEYEKAKKIMDAAKNELYPFGEYDN